MSAMTKLDAKALEAARVQGAYLGIPSSDVATVLNAYLDALPPAKRMWAWMADGVETMCIYETEEIARAGLPEGDRVMQVEIREVRS